MFDNYMNRLARQGQYMGQVLKNQSDMIMDATFMNDPAYRVCYLQDRGAIFPEQTLDGYKKAKAVFAGNDVYDMDDLQGFQRIDAKYLVKSYLSIQADTIDYMLQFRPNVHGSNPNIRVGAYVFIPDDLGVYNLWIIVARDDRPQFPQFYVLKCDFLAKWYISEEDRVRYEGVHVDTGTYFSWAVARIQSSYNSGVWTDYSTTVVENQKKLWFPTNRDTQTITYNKHITITNNPLRRAAWEVSKVMDTEPIGLTKITFTQELEHNSCDDMSWVNIYSDEISSTSHGAEYDFYEPRINDKTLHTEVLPFDIIEVEEINKDKNLITYSGVKSSVKVGGSYKTFTAKLDIIGKPYWSIDYVSNGEVVCTLDFMYNGNNLICNDYYDSFEIIDTNKISYYQDDRKIFGIQFKYNEEKPNELKIKCQSVLGMIGNKIIIKAGDSSFETSASLEVEVEAL